MAVLLTRAFRIQSTAIPFLSGGSHCLVLPLHPRVHSASPVSCLRTFVGKMTTDGSTTPVGLPLAEKAALSYEQPIAVHGPGGRVRIAALTDSRDSESFIGKQVCVCGWSRSVRKQGGGNLCFVVLTDGSTSTNLQVVVENGIENFDQVQKCGAGCSFRFCGRVVESPAKGQKVELQVKDSARGKRWQMPLLPTGASDRVGVCK